MAMLPEFMVARKEFRDHITSKRFLAILSILMLLSVYGMATGMYGYNKKMDDYKKSQTVPQEDLKYAIQMYQQQIKNAEDTGAPVGYTNDLRNRLKSLEDRLNPPIPSVLDTFGSMLFLLSIIGMLIGAALGFEGVTKEKEDGTFKNLLSGPVNRSTVITGKAIGALAILAVALAIAFIITIIILLIYGMVPGFDDLIRIFAFFIASLLYCTVFYAIALMMSTITRSSSMSMLFTIGIVFLLVIFSLLAFIFADFVAGSMVGPAPQMDDNGTIPAGNGYDASTSSGNPFELMPQAGPIIFTGSEYDKYITNRMYISQQITDAICTISPISDFSGTYGTGYGGISGAILSKQTPGVYSDGYDTTHGNISLIESLSYVWVKILALIIMIILAFSVTYYKFGKTDIA